MHGRTPTRSAATRSVSVVAVALALLVTPPAIATASPYADAVGATSGLSAHWRLGEAPVALFAADQTGMYPGAILGGTLGTPGLVVGDPDTAYESGYMTVPYSPALNTTAFSVEFWLRVDGGSGFHRQLVSSRNTTLNTGYMIRKNADQTASFYVGNGSNFYDSVVVPVGAGRTRHLVFTYAYPYARGYVDGELVNTRRRGFKSNTSIPFTLGTATYRYEGVVDELAYYGRDLTPEEIAGHWAAGIGTNAPETQIDSGPAPLVSESDAELTFSSPDETATFECRLDEDEWSACVSPQSYSGLSDGAHEFEVRTRTAEGALDGTPAAHSWTVDTTPPETTIVEGPAGAVEETSATFNLSASEEGSTFECQLDGGGWSPCEPAPEHTGLENGEHTFEARATDPAGVTDPTPAVRTWTIEAKPDLDDDGAPNRLEHLAGTDPDDPDSAPPATVVFVDGASLAGPCSDAWTWQEARSEEAPWCTPARAARAAPDGALVIVRGGTYGDMQVIDRPARQEIVTFRASALEPGQVVLNGIYTRRSGYLRFEGMRIPGRVYIGVSVNVAFVANDFTSGGLEGGGVTVKAGRDFLFEDNRFHDFRNSSRALETDGSTSNYAPSMVGVHNVTIRRNRFERIAHDAVAIFHGPFNVLIEDNEFVDVIRPAGSDLHTDAIQIAPLKEGGRDVVVRRNHINRGTQGIFIKDGAVHELVVESNVVGPTESWNFSLHNGPGARIAGNTFAGKVRFTNATSPSGCIYGRTTTCVYQKDPATRTLWMRDAFVANNIFSRLYVEEDIQPFAYEDHNLIGAVAVWNTGAPGPHDLRGSPQFVNAAAYDFRLAAGSLGIDAGTSLGTPATDLLESPRVDDVGVPDIGAGPETYWDIGGLERQLP